MNCIKRIAKRAAALLLCVVMLSVNVPQASAEALPQGFVSSMDEQAMIEALKMLDSAKLAELQRQIDLYNGVGHFNNVIRSGQYTGQPLMRVIEGRDEVLRRLTGGAGAAETAAVAARLPMAMRLLSALKMGGILLLPFLDWPDIISDVANGGPRAENLFLTDSLFYDFVVNLTWFDHYISIFADPADLEAAGSTEAYYWEVTKEGWGIINDWFSGLFGGSQELPGIDHYQALNMMNASIVAETSSYTEYKLPIGTYFEAGGQPSYRGGNIQNIVYEVKWIKSGYYELDNSVKCVNTSGSMSVTNANLHIRIWKSIQQLTVQNGYPTYPYDVEIAAEGCFGSLYRAHNIYVFKEALGLPSTPYINNIDAIKDQLDRIEDKLDSLVVQFPQIEPSGDPFIDFMLHWDELQDWDPFENIETSPNPKPDPKPKPDPETEPDEDDDDDDSSYHLFPFCIPFDVVNMIKGLRDTPEAPRWEIPFPLPGALASFMGKESETIVIDLSPLEQVMPLVRFFILAVFVMLLMTATSRFIKW